MIEVVIYVLNFNTRYSQEKEGLLKCFKWRVFKRCYKERYFVWAQRYRKSCRNCFIEPNVLTYHSKTLAQKSELDITSKFALRTLTARKIKRINHEAAIDGKCLDELHWSFMCVQSQLRISALYCLSVSAKVLLFQSKPFLTSRCRRRRICLSTKITRLRERLHHRPQECNLPLFCEYMWLLNSKVIQYSQILNYLRSDTFLSTAMPLRIGSKFYITMACLFACHGEIEIIKSLNMSWSWAERMAINSFFWPGSICYGNCSIDIAFSR